MRGRPKSQEPLGIRYEIASFSDLSIFKDESFDTVVSTMALMDSRIFDKAVAEIYRLLKKNGNFFSAFPPMLH